MSKYSYSKHVGDDIVQLCKDLGAKMHSDKEKEMIKDLFRQGHRELAAQEALLGSIFRIAQKVFHQNKNRVTESNMEDCVMWALCCVYEQLHRYYDPDRAQVSTFVDKVLTTSGRRLLLQKVPYQDAVGSCPPLREDLTEDTKQLIYKWQSSHRSMLRLNDRSWEKSAAENIVCSRYTEADLGDKTLEAGESLTSQYGRMGMASALVSRIADLLYLWCKSEDAHDQALRDTAIWLSYRVDQVPGPKTMTLYGIGSRQRLSQIIIRMDALVRKLVWADPTSLEALETAIDYEVDQ